MTNRCISDTVYHLLAFGEYTLWACVPHGNLLTAGGISLTYTSWPWFIYYISRVNHSAKCSMANEQKCGCKYRHISHADVMKHDMAGT